MCGYFVVVVDGTVAGGLQSEYRNRPETAFYAATFSVARVDIYFSGDDLTMKFNSQVRRIFLGLNVQRKRIHT